MTGIQEQDLAAAEPSSATRSAVSESLRKTGICVAHYARFERRFVGPFVAEDPDGDPDIPWLCTHAMATRLYPGLPRRGLRAMAGYFGHRVPEKKRAGHHAFATAIVWRHLVDELRHREGIETLQELQTWLEDTPEQRPDSLTYSMDRKRRLGLPEAPGTYTFLTSNDDPLYVGKASDLKQRVNSYFQSRRGLSSRKLEMVTQVDDVRVEPAETALEAALLESDRIKELEPPYNRALRTRDRRLRWLSSDATHVARSPDSSHPFGPLGSRATGQFLSALRVSLMGGEPAPGLLRTHGDDAEAAADVLELAFRGGLDLPQDVEALRRRGIRLWEEKLQQEDEESQEDAESKEADDLTPERAVERLESQLRHATRHIRKARWMQALLEADIAWRPTHSRLGEEESAYRVLHVSGGDVVLARWASDEVVDDLLQNPGHDEPAAPDEPWDIATFDRLAVLVSEIRRLLRTRSGRDSIRLRASGGLHYDAGSLRAVLRWI
jgi:DNA polymerase-3 subunit epsilon